MEERFGPVGNERYKEYLKDVHTSGTHVLSLVNDLLDLSKIEAGKMELAPEDLDANATIGECVSIMQTQANQQRVIVRLSLAPRLPRIRADERSLRQILLNLLSNAVKFNEPGGQVIVSSAQTDAGFVVIRVKDTGIGMSDDEIDIALEPFRQVATSRKTTGTGLGLPVTKALIEANHASFTIKSRKNEGTLIEVAFPRRGVWRRSERRGGNSFLPLVGEGGMLPKEPSIRPGYAGLPSPVPRTKKEEPQPRSKIRLYSILKILRHFSPLPQDRSRQFGAWRKVAFGVAFSLRGLPIACRSYAQKTKNRGGVRIERLRRFAFVRFFFFFFFFFYQASETQKGDRP